MPIYEYDCPKCGRFETIQKITDEPLTKCPGCEKNGVTTSVQRAVSPAAFHLKGSGWYKTDYGSSSSSGKNGSSSAAPKKENTSADAGSAKSDGGGASSSASAASAPSTGGCGSGCKCH